MIPLSVFGAAVPRDAQGGGVTYVGVGSGSGKDVEIQIPIGEPHPSRTVFVAFLFPAGIVRSLGIESIAGIAPMIDVIDSYRGSACIARAMIATGTTATLVTNTVTARTETPYYAHVWTTTGAVDLLRTHQAWGGGDVSPGDFMILGATSPGSKISAITGADLPPGHPQLPTPAVAASGVPTGPTVVTVTDVAGNGDRAILAAYSIGA